MPTEREFHAWQEHLRVTHPEMFRDGRTRRRGARNQWHPLLLRVYGIRPWEMGLYTLRECGLMYEDLEKHGLGGGLGG